MIPLQIPLIPEQASEFATDVDNIVIILTALTVFFTVLVMTLLLVLAIRYRRGSKANRERVSHHNYALELGWSLPPLFIGLAMFVWSAQPYAKIFDPPKDAEEVFV